MASRNCHSKRNGLPALATSFAVSVAAGLLTSHMVARRTKKNAGATFTPLMLFEEDEIATSIMAGLNDMGIPTKARVVKDGIIALLVPKSMESDAKKILKTITPKVASNPRGKGRGVRKRKPALIGKIIERFSMKPYKEENGIEHYSGKCGFDGFGFERVVRKNFPNAGFKILYDDTPYQIVFISDNKRTILEYSEGDVSMAYAVTDEAYQKWKQYVVSFYKETGANPKKKSKKNPNCTDSKVRRIAKNLLDEESILFYEDTLGYLRSRGIKRDAKKYAEYYDENVVDKKAIDDLSKEIRMISEDIESCSERKIVPLTDEAEYFIASLKRYAKNHKPKKRKGKVPPKKSKKNPKKNSGLFDPMKSKKYADMISIKTLPEAKKSITAINKEWKSAKTHAKKVRLVKVMTLAMNRAGVFSRNKRVSKKVRDEKKQIHALYKKWVDAHKGKTGTPKSKKNPNEVMYLRDIPKSVIKDRPKVEIIRSSHKSWNGMVGHLKPVTGACHDFDGAIAEVDLGMTGKYFPETACLRRNDQIMILGKSKKNPSKKIRKNPVANISTLTCPDDGSTLKFVEIVNLEDGNVAPMFTCPKCGKNYLDK